MISFCAEVLTNDELATFVDVLQSGSGCIQNA